MRSRFGRAGESFVRGPAAALHPIPVTNGEISGSPIPLQFPLSPMRFFAIEIEHAGLRWIACNMAIRACMTGPRPPAAKSRVSVAVCHSGAMYSAFGNLVM